MKLLNTNMFSLVYNANTDNLDKAELWSNYLADASVIVAGISCGMNIMIITTLSYAKQKTRLKLVLSLAAADLLLAAFNVIVKFVKFPIPWENLIELSLTFRLEENVTFNGEELGDSFLLVKEEETYLLPRITKLNKDIITDWITDKNNTSNTNNLNNSNLTFVSEGKEQEITRMPDQNSSTLMKEILAQTSEYMENVHPEYSPVHLLMACIYLIPNITNVMTMFFITIHLLVLIAKPLQQQIILSNSRVIKIVIGVWGCGTTVAAIVYGVLLSKKNMTQVPYIIQSAWLAIWYGTTLCFVAIAVLYCIILVTLRKQRSIQSSRMASTRKAAITALIVVFSFAVFDLPFVWISVLNHIIPAHKRINIDIKQVFRLLFVMNTIVDSLIYTIRLPEVAMGLRKLKRQMTYSRVLGTEIGSELKSIGK